MDKLTNNILYLIKDKKLISTHIKAIVPNPLVEEILLENIDNLDILKELTLPNYPLITLFNSNNKVVICKILQSNLYSPRVIQNSNLGAFFYYNAYKVYNKINEYIDVNLAEFLSEYSEDNFKLNFRIIYNDIMIKPVLTISKLESELFKLLELEYKFTKKSQY